jgi:hypothetical protein
VSDPPTPGNHALSSLRKREKLGQGNLDFVSKPSIEVLELPSPRHIDLFNSCPFSNLRCLVLDEHTEPDKVLISQFWKNHSKLERIEVGSDVDGDRWFSGVSLGWLPHLQTLKVRRSTVWIPDANSFMT